MSALELLIDAALVAMQACWLTLGAVTNVRHPEHNRTYVDAVLSLELIREEAPDTYAAHAHRRVLSARVREGVFKALVAVEIAISAALWLAVVLLVVAAADGSVAAVARAVALLAVLGFTALWGAFLVGGEWFVYWASARTPQYTHFFMLLWGLLTLIWLA